MIKRIKKIDDFHVFNNFLWPSDLADFRKYNLIYGWNGSGKTTLSNLFRQIEEKNIADGCGEFQIDTDTGVLTEGTISETDLQIKVFNQDFIKENVFTKTGEVSPIFFIGKQGISKQRELDELKEQLLSLENEERSLSQKLSQAETKYEKFCSEKAKNIRDFLRSGGDNQYNNYNKAKFKPKCTSLLKKDYKKLILIDKKFDELKDKIQSIPKEKLPKVNTDFDKIHQLFPQTKSVLEKTVVTETIERFEKNDKVNRWAEQGLKLLKVSNTRFCPFCNHEIPNDEIKKLELHFNDEYENLVSEIEILIDETQTQKEKCRIFLPPIKEFYSEYAEEYEKNQKKLLEELKKYSLFIDKILEILEKKKSNPFKKITLNEIYSISDLENTIDAINIIIEQHNQKTTNFLSEIEKSRMSLETHFVSECLDEYCELEKTIPSFSDNLEKVRQKIGNWEDLIIKLQSEIVGHRQPAEEINRDLYSYLGRKEIKFQVQENGYLITRNGIVATALSEGEKTAISFIYFLKSLKDKDFDIAQGIVVIDDPISSLDSNSLYNAFGFMKNRTKDASQIFVLTHNFSFFNEVKNWWKHDKSNTSYYMLTNGIEHKNRVARLVPLDNLLKTYNSEYHYLFKLVYNQAMNNAEDFENYYLLPNISRRLLESFLAFRVPSVSGNLLKQLNKIQFDNDKKVRIYRYINENSHGGHIRNDVQDDLSFLAETKEVLNDILKLIENEDEKHFLEMKSLIEPVAS